MHFLLRHKKTNKRTHTHTVVYQYQMLLLQPDTTDLMKEAEHLYKLSIKVLNSFCGVLNRQC